MATAQDPLEPILAEIRGAARHSQRTSLRFQAEAYRRDGRTLFYWCFAPSRAAVRVALAEPEDAAATRHLCHALWRDLRTAKALPRYLAGRTARIGSLRVLFACECALYNRQRRAAKTAGKERAPTTGEWLTGLCRAIEESPATPRAGTGPQGASACQPEIIPARSRGPAAGTGNRRRR